MPADAAAVTRIRYVYDVSLLPAALALPRLLRRYTYARMPLPAIADIAAAPWQRCMLSTDMRQADRGRYFAAAARRLRDACFATL